jgi:hypothetical protein
LGCAEDQRTGVETMTGDGGGEAGDPGTRLARTLALQFAPFTLETASVFPPVTSAPRFTNPFLSRLPLAYDAHHQSPCTGGPAHQTGGRMMKRPQRNRSKDDVTGGFPMRQRLAALVFLASAVALAADPPPAVTTHAIPKEKGKFHLFLLVGQSNMAGRGIVDPTNNVPHPRVWMLDRENQWVPAKEPIHFDKPAVAGVGLSCSFAKALADADPEIQIGLIPCAMGGSAIDEWKPGQKFFRNAIERATKAQETGTLQGILWHQGESDASDDKAQVYGEKLQQLIAAFREQLHAADVPFVAGELGRWHTNAAGQKINADLHALAATVPHYAWVSSEGLERKPNDKPHFDTPSLREFGLRYAAAYRKLTSPAK